MITPFSIIKNKWDANALAFIAAAGITDYTDKLAINYAVNTLKAANIWTKTVAFYPFLGLTATTQKYNAVNPAQYQITWVNTPYHSHMGVRFNGTNQYGRLGIIPNSVFTINSSAISVYSRTNISTAGRIIGVTNSATQIQNIIPRNGANLTSANYSNTNQLSVAVSDSLRAITVTKTASNSLKLFKLGVQVGATQTGNAGTLPTLEFYLGASNSAGSPASYWAGELNFLIITSGLTDGEAAVLDTIEETFNTIVSRGNGQGYNISYEGDSFMSANGDIVARMNTFLTNNTYRYAYLDRAVSAAAIGYPLGTNNYMLYATRYAAVTANYQSIAGKNILICHEGLNDVNYYLDLGAQTAPNAATSTYNNYVAYYGALAGQASLGYKCIFNTITPRSGAGPHANYEAARQNASDKYDAATLNGKLRNDFTVATAHARIFTSNLAKWAGCILCDLGDDPDFGQAGQSTDLTWYNADGTHPNGTMCQAIIDRYYGPAANLIRSGLV